MAWRKTDHVYPRARLGDVLIRMRFVSMSEVEMAAANLPKGLRIGEYLVQLRKVTEESLYRALRAQYGMPAGPASVRDVDRLATRLLPAAVSRRWSVLPFRVESGKLHVAISDVPSREAMRELDESSGLDIYYCLVRPAELERLTRLYLPSAA
jgi:hypothetical protein